MDLRWLWIAALLTNALVFFVLYHQLGPLWAWGFIVGYSGLVLAWYFWFLSRIEKGR